MENHAYQEGSESAPPPSPQPPETTIFELDRGKWLEIGGLIELVVLEIDAEKVAFGINCPNHVRVE